MQKTVSYIKERIAIAVVLCALVLVPGTARAQCEVGTAMATAAVVATSLETALRLNYYCVQPTGLPGLLCSFWQISTQVATAGANAALQIFETLLYARLRQFWTDWLKALQDMTAQLHASMSDGSRGLNNLFDTGEMTRNQRSLQQVELQAKKQYMPTDEGCRFDTAGAKLGSAKRVTRVMSRGIGKQFNDVGGNAAGSSAERGPAGVHAARWDNYYNLFCDTTMNGGRAGCPGSNPDGTGGTTQELANANVIVSKTLFGKETIPMNDTAPTGIPNAPTVGAGWKSATDEIIYNLTGYEAPQPIPSDALAASNLKDRRLETRSYATQMDVVVSLVADIVAERTPGEESPEVQQLRQSNGITDANTRPSEREIRQSTLEELWNPNYYVNLQDTSSATARKEVYLKAYNLMLLYKLVAKTEMIANAFVVETGNLIQTYQGGKASSQRSSVPIRP